MANVNAGDRVKLTLLSTKTELKTRIDRGITDLVHVGRAARDLVEGESFILNVSGSMDLRTSRVKKVLANTFSTENSTYQYEVLP